MVIARKIISYILAVIVSILMIFSILFGSINSNILNKNNIKKSFQKSDYYYNLYAIIKENTENEIMPSGFEATILDNVFTEEKLKEDVNTLIDCLYDNKKFEISTESIKKTLDENVQREMQEKNYVVNEENQKNIDEFENAIIETYINHINYSEKTVNQIGEYMQKIQSIMKIAIIALYVITVILLVVLFLLNKCAIGISFIISGMFFIVLNVYSGTAVAVNNILLFNWAFSKTIIYILNQILQRLFTTGIVLSVAGVAIIVGIEYIRAKKFVNEKIK